MNRITDMNPDKPTHSPSKGFTSVWTRGIPVIDEDTSAKGTTLDDHIADGQSNTGDMGYRVHLLS